MTNVIENWIVDRANFKGYAQTFTYIDEEGTERTAYTEQTAIEYLDQHPGYELLTDGELQSLENEYYKSQCTKWRRISREKYYEMLECLPPARWTHFDGGEVFHVIERLQGPLVSWYMIRNGRYYTKTDYYCANIEVLINGESYPVATTTEQRTKLA